MQLSQATTEQARTIRELEAPADTPPGEQVWRDPGSEAPAQGSSTRESGESGSRPWWRRWFG